MSYTPFFVIYKNKEMCLIFAACVLILTVLWIYIGKDWSFSFLANAMFFPTLLLPLFVENYVEFIITITGINEVKIFFLYIIKVYIKIGTEIMEWFFEITTLAKINIKIFIMVRTEWVKNLFCCILMKLGHIYRERWIWLHSIDRYTYVRVTTF